MNDASEAVLKKYRCPSCGYENQVAVMPWHYLYATHTCVHCERPHSIKTRESSTEQFEGLVDENKEVERCRVRGRAYSIPQFSKAQIRREMEQVQAKLRKADTEPVVTPFGPALLIDP